MQLTGLEIYGFKSFADRTKFAFDKGITGVVGPNGCGKSNIVDAIRWVLGEQSAKYLRSDKMENIIFNGTQNRRKANFAEVSLTFDNTKNLLPTEYTSITIARKLYRSGESEYLLNGVTCRLKDITNLFMDTGIASNSYAIIELKMVEEMLTNKDQERRRFFEEAAGISKYKVRKKQTLKKLEETDGDLMRVEDLLAEIDKNLKSLEKQAKRTQKYVELKEQYRIVSSQFAYLKLQTVRDQQEKIEKQERQLSDELTEVQTQISLREARLMDLRKQQIDNEQALAEAQQQLNQHIRTLQQAESEKNVKNERLKYLHQREIALNNQITTEQKQWEKTELDKELLSNQKEAKETELQGHQKTEQTLKADLQKLQEKQFVQQRNTQQLDNEYKTIDNELRQLLREKDMQQVRMKSLEGELRRAEEDKSARSYDLDEFAEKADLLTKEVEELSAELKDLQEKKIAHEKAVKDTEELQAKHKDDLYKIQRNLDAKYNEYNLIKSLVDKLEGFPESVKFLKKNAIWIKDAPLLSDIFTAADDYKVAIEQFLEPYLSYYVVENRKEALQAIELLVQASKGRANFFILDEIQAHLTEEKIQDNFTPALSLIDVSAKYLPLAQYLLQNVYIIDNEAEIPQNIPENVVFIRKDGKSIHKKQVEIGGSLGAFEGKRLGRAKNLAALEKEVSTLRLDVEDKKKELQLATNQLDTLKKQNYQKDIEPLSRKIMEKQKDLQLLSTREKEHREFLHRVGQRTDALSQEFQVIIKNLKEIEPEIQEKQVFTNRTLRDVAEAKEELQELNNEVNALSQQYNQAHIQLIHLQNHFQNLVGEIDRKTFQAQQLSKNIAQMKTENEAARKDIEQLIAVTSQGDSEILELNEKKKVAESLTNKREQKLGETKNLIRQQEENIEIERKKRENIVLSQLALKEKITEIRLQMNSLRERMAVEFQIEIESISAIVFEKHIDEYSIIDIELGVNKLRQQIQNFGEINPLALEAFKEMEERYHFIHTQCEDLRAAKQVLLDTISEIDETAKIKFMETFVAVREHFIRVFRSLFTESDTCDLFLTDPTNPLDSEIDIIARPKGKRPLTITQLSGGEKTLTAVALLFSIYLIKPAPFCIFDEVDAPLDDANIDKFNNIIRDFSKESQFIIVTHNKRTMASTSVMYGITMEDAGVSRALPVSLEALNLN